MKIHTHTYRGPIFVLRIRWVQGQRPPLVAALVLAWCFGGLLGCAWNPRGERVHCTQIITAHQMLPLSRLFTQQLCWAGTWMYREACTHRLMETYLIIHQDGGQELIGKRCFFSMICCLGRDMLLFASAEWVTAHTSKLLQSLFSIMFSQPTSVCSLKTVEPASTWHKSVASAIHRPSPNPSPVEYLWPLYHATYMSHIKYIIFSYFTDSPLIPALLIRLIRELDTEASKQIWLPHLKKNSDETSSEPFW